MRLFTLVFFTIYLASCSSDDYIPQIQPSTNLIQMEGEGGSTEVSFIAGNWKITGVININGDVKISGDTYSADDEPIRKNYTLSLEELGRMEALLLPVTAPPVSILN